MMSEFVEETLRNYPQQHRSEAEAWRAATVLGDAPALLVRKIKGIPLAGAAAIANAELRRREAKL